MQVVNARDAVSDGGSIDIPADTGARAEPERMRASPDPARDAQALQLLHRLGRPRRKRIERVGRGTQIVDRHAPRLEREPAKPAHRGSLVASRIATTQDEAYPERVVERNPRELEGGGGHQRLVAGLEGTPEPAVGVAVAGHANICSQSARMNCRAPVRGEGEMSCTVPTGGVRSGRARHSGLWKERGGVEMAVKAAELEAELIDTVCARVRERLGDHQSARCEAFVRQYYHWVPAADLTGRSPLDLYGAALTHWNLLQHRAPGQIKVHVYNPDFEHHGWQSPHTVAEIVTDDMPFLVDSVTMELARAGHAIDLVIHPVIRVRRDPEGNLIDVLEPGADAGDAVAESVLHAEVAREPDRELLDRLHQSLERVLGEVNAAVADWHAMRGRAEALIGELDEHEPPIDSGEVRDAKEFLAWLADNHFTFLGYREYELVQREDRTALQAIAESGLGILRGKPRTPYTELSPKALTLARAPHVLVLTKANSRATVHRPAYLDYVGVKTFGADGEVTGERRFLGLYTTTAYKASPREIPLLRGKVGQILARAGFPPDSHDAKALLEILESYPRDSLFQAEVDDLFEVAMGILSLGERQRVRLFVLRDALDRFVECLVCIPRDRFNTENRERVARILIGAFGGTHVDWTLQLSESLLARVRYIIHSEHGVPHDYDVAEIEARLVRATRAWSDDLRAALIEVHGEDRGSKIHRRYERAFPPAYRDDWVARSAVADIARIEDLSGAEEPIMSLYRPLEAPEGMVRCKLFSAGGVSLSDVLPTFEHMGARVVDERPYEISPADRASVWIYDFGLQCVADDVDRVGSLFQDAFLGVWRGDLEDDGLNALVLRAALTGEQITIIRAIAKYLRQAGIPFSDAYMERTMLAHPAVTRLLVALFTVRFDPERRDSARAERLVQEIEAAIDAVQSLDEDRILRSFLSVIRAMLRTNYFRIDGSGNARSYLSFKLDPSLVPVLPLPRPRFEIFVYSPRVEGVHLRGGKVARGGLRWSDRREDFRTEILGLMKAQMVKNALIVPVGSKGGFVLKRPPAQGGREAIQREAIHCYKTLLRGMLDITDNIVGGEVVGPDRVVRYDEDDPYLVVAADKGHSDVLGHRQRGLGVLRLLARRRVCLRRLEGVRPQADGHHRPRCVGVGQAALPGAGNRYPADRLHRRRDRRHVGRRVRQRDAALAAHQARSPRSITCTCFSIPIRIRSGASKSASECSSSSDRAGATTTRR